MGERALVALAVASAAAAMGIAWFDKRKAQEPPALPNGQWSLAQLLIASFLTLFLELAFIRWISVEIRVFAYFKNLALLLCFLGFGIGCALARERLRISQGVAGLLALLLSVRLPIPGWSGRLEDLSETLGRSPGLGIWGTGKPGDWEGFLAAALMAAGLLYFLASIFVPLGQIVSRQLDLAPRTLRAYSWNLAASLAGILAFFGACWKMLPPEYWFATALAGMALLQRRRSHGYIVACLIVPAVALTHSPRTPEKFSLWTPYQQIQMVRADFADGELKGYTMYVNHAGYQKLVDLAPDFLRRHPGLLKERPADNPYNIAYRFAVPHPRVLILGAGAGNDAAAALRNGSSAVDIVEIDPAIWRIGRLLHPEHPYQSPLINAHITDARAFLKRSQAKYDLIMFGLLDSHITFSDYSNMRIDNFVYTRQSIEEAKQLLAPDGVLFVKFQVDFPWMGKRIDELLTTTFGKPPLIFYAPSSYTVEASCFVISPSDRVQRALAADPALAAFTRNPPPFVHGATVPITTDDWPYLYQEWKTIPRAYWTLGVLVLLIGLVFWGQIPGARRRPPSLFYFGMGAGFMLLETQAISRLALFYGTTWQVNGIVIAAILSALLAANAVVERFASRLARVWMVAGLLGGLVIAYAVPFNRLPGSADAVGIAAAVAFAIPVFFAGLLFAYEFRDAISPSAALGANMLGAVVGGLLENVSLIIGMRALVLVAIALYGLAAVGLRRESRAPLPAESVSETTAAVVER